jgi:type IV pilus assembly protein PilY1
MQTPKLFAKLQKHLLIALSAASTALAITHSAQAEPFQTPLFLVTQVKPVTMLNMSRDHQLFFKLYDDYSDITDSRSTINSVANANYGKEPDGAPDTSYVHGFDYYGYFDSYKCYTYSTTDNRFNPVSFTANKYCNSSASNQWSGNFLNWASMTRVDAIRKMLYGGMRFIDTTSATVLERAYLPTDAHSFAKYYAGSDLPQLTPFAVNQGSAVAREQGITICNTSDPGTATLSQAATSAAGARPLLRVAQGNYSLWASNERWQCRWRSSISDTSYGVNGNTSASGIDAYSDSPIDDHKLGTGSAAGEYVARVSVCVTDLLAFSTDKNNEKCLGYAGDTVFKPTGLLQEYANTQHFGLITGSYGKNKSGGVLRKQVGSINDEINSNGIFQVPAGGKSIIKTLDSLRIYGYRYGQGLGLYHNNNHVVNTPGASQNDGCLWGTSSFSDGQCVNWGNPQAEIYLESLRYLSGATSPQFDSNDSAYIAGLDRVTSWTDPITPAPAGNYCAPINIIQFDASMTSYDSNSLTNAPSTIGDIDTATDFIGTSEGIHNNIYFVGENGSNNDQLCTPKSITNLSSVKGACPDAPRLEGSYKIAGLAHKARSVGIGSDRKKPKTYGVALAAAVPNVVVPVPGSNKKISILPACRNSDLLPKGNCAIVDFKVVSQISDSTTENSGKLYVSWEDTEQGGDYDQDMWGIIEYKVTANNVTVTTDVIAESTIYDMGFGYIIGGTDNDGFHVHSGIEGYSEYGCTNCQTANGPTSKPFGISQNSSAKLLDPALKYAAKWGGYKDDNATTSDIATSTPETYFKAVDPRKLESSLRAVFDALSRTGSSTTVASNSTRIDSDTNIFQALFDSRDWSGSLQAFPIKEDGTIDAANKAWDTNDTLKPSENISRNIYTYNGTSAVALTVSGFNSAPTALRDAFKLAAEADYTKAALRYQWLMGKPIDSLRPRTYLLGDIINSDPAYAGANNQRYNLLPSAYGASEYEAYLLDPESSASKVNRTKAVFVGANDGMLHAFNVANGQELFAFIPRGVYSKLASLSKTDYQHAYTVDGPVYVGDAYIDHNADGEKTWRTLVGGTLGAGGRGAYLLDVTDVLNGSNNAPRVIFDIYAGDSNPTLSNDLGYSTSKMLIVPTADEGWSAIFGNGTESVNGTAKLITINVEIPSTYKVIDTNTTTGSGLSGVALLPNGDGVSTYAYAGDIKGNMWKFDLTSTNRNSWTRSFNGPLIKVIDGSGNAQPITGTPTLGRNAKKMAGNGANAVPSVMVYFGTGSYSELNDLNSLAVQSIYAIADTNSAISLTVSNRNSTLVRKSITAETSTQRTVSPDATTVTIGQNGQPIETPAVDWTSTSPNRRGWYLDLIYSNTAKGERVIAKPLLLFDRLIVNTFIPEPYQCSNGGSGWLMELTGVGDRFIGLTVLKNNKNQRLLEPIVGDLLPIMSGEAVFIVGSSLTAEAENPGSALEVFEGQAGAGSRGRMSWRQLK